MRLFLALFLTVTAVFADSAKVFRAGAATSVITPEPGVVLDGAIMQIGPAKKVHDDLHARCLVLDDGGTRVALVVCDVTMISAEVVAKAKAIIQQTTSLPPQHVLISATHTHSSPRVIALGLGEANDRYESFFATRVAEGVRRAIANLAPAKIGWGSAARPEFLFNRRSYVKPEHAPPNPFTGKPEQVAMGASAVAFIKPAGPVDPELSVLSVRHADDRPLAVLANYGLHYIGGVPAGEISADYFGVFAAQIESMLGAAGQQPPFIGIMSNGTSGDVNGNDPLHPAKGNAPYTRMTAVATSLAETAAGIVRSIQHHDWVPLAARSSVLDLAVRKPDAARLEWARSQAGEGRGIKRLSRPAIYAREALQLATYPDRASVELQAIRIGTLGIAAGPNEIFAETGLAIKKDSPFEKTFIIELANGYSGYLPTPAQHALGGYETWNARSSFLEIEAEPKIRAGMLDALRSLTAAQDAPAGQRVFTAGHSLLMYLPRILKPMVADAKIIGHRQVGSQSVGGSPVSKQWELADELNKAKTALKAGEVEVLMLSPIYLPDDGIEKFATLALQHNPNVRVTVQEFWIPYDDPKVLKAGAGPKVVERHHRTLDELRTMHAAYFAGMDAHIRSLNEKLGKPVLHIVPVGQAVMALRGKIIAGTAPGLRSQNDLFRDGLGHPLAALRALSAYCHFAVIYRRNPIGLPIPEVLQDHAEAEKLNTLLQQLAWDAVTSHPLSGVTEAK